MNVFQIAKGLYSYVETSVLQVGMLIKSPYSRNKYFTKTSVAEIEQDYTFMNMNCINITICNANSVFLVSDYNRWTCDNSSLCYPDCI